VAAERAVFIGMGEVGHFQRMRPLIAEIAERGLEPVVLTDRRFRDGVESAGGRFDDMLGRHPLEAADDESIPIPCRFVSFAGSYGEAIIEEIGALDPALILYDTFAVIGHIAGRALDVPYVNVCAGHAREPGRFLAEQADDPPPLISDACRSAVDVLRDRYGIADANPFSYVSGLSPHLNVYCEPEEFLPEGEREAFEPVAFHGSLPSPELGPWGPGGGSGANGQPFGDDEAAVRIYASFGTVVWRYWPEVALAALEAIADAAASMPDAEALISLGGAQLGAEARARLERPGVAVRDYVDQWAVLGRADVFFTHQGLNSTHEAILHRVPMASYPFFTDQPALAERCRSFGFAAALSDSKRGPVSPERVAEMLDEIKRERESYERNLERARGWELRTIRERPEVIDRVLALAL